MNRLLRFLLVGIGMVVLSWGTAEAVSITVIANWDLNIPAKQIVDGQTSYKSAPNQVRLRISGTTGPWKVYVRKDDTNWHRNLVLKVRKTSGKTKPIVTVQDTNTEFFSGDKDGNHNVQFILDGVSIAIPPDAYTTRLIYTITEE